MIFRKVLWFGVVVAIATALALVPSSQAQTRGRDRVSGPPTVSLTADPNVLRVCAGEAANVRLTSNAASSSGNERRFKWTATGGAPRRLCRNVSS